MIRIRRRWSSAGRPVPVCKASHGLSSLTTKPASADVPGRRIGLGSVMISGGLEGRARLSWPPLPLVRWRWTCVSIPLDLGRSQSGHVPRVPRYDLSGGGTGDRKLPVCALALQLQGCGILWSQGSQGGGLAYLVYINVVNPGWYSRNRHVDQKSKNKGRRRVDSSRLAPTGVTVDPRSRRSNVSRCNLTA